MANKTIAEHIRRYRAALLRKQNRIQSGPAGINALETRISGLQFEIDTAMIESGSSDISEQLDQLICERRKLQEIVEKLEGELEDIDVEIVNLNAVNRFAAGDETARNAIPGGVRKGWGKWGTREPAAPVRYYDQRIVLRDGTKTTRRIAVELGRQIDPETGKYLRGKKVTPYKTINGRGYTKKDFRRYYGKARFNFVARMIGRGYPKKIIYNVTGLSSLQQDKFERDNAAKVDEFRVI